MCLCSGPAPSPPVPECPDFVTALDIFVEMARRLCAQNVPVIEAGQYEVLVFFKFLGLDWHLFQYV